MAMVPSNTPQPYNDADALKKFLDDYEEDEPDHERLVLFKDKDGQVHIISKKINKFEGFWADIGLSKKHMFGFGLADANIKHVLRHLNEKKICDPRLWRLVQRYNSKRKFGKIKKSDFPNLFPAVEKASE